MSNLQCPVTVILTAPGDALRLVRRLRDERISTLWCDSQTSALHAAEVMAAELGVPVRPAQAASADELESLADEFRGETVLGIVSEPLLTDLLGQLSPSHRQLRRAPGAAWRLSYDGEAWTIGS
jgi:hypothetical protein